MKTFIWKPLIEPQGQFSHRVLSAKFGDGYEQTAGDGLNPTSQSWPLEFLGREELIAPIKNFLLEHTGHKSFLWTAPMGTEEAWRAPKGFTLKPHGGDVWRLGVTFELAPKP